MPEVLARTVRAQARALLGWTVGLIAYAWLIVLTFPATKDMDFQPIEQHLRFFLGGADTLSTIEGWLTSQIFYLPPLLGLYLILLSVRLVDGERRSGMMDFLLSHPISRQRVITEKYLGLLAMLVYLSLLFGVTVWLASLTIDDAVGLTGALLAGLNLIPIVLLYCSIAFCLACVSASRHLVVGVASAFAVFSWVLHGLAEASSALAAIREWTVFYWYASARPFSDGLVAAHVLVLLALSAMLFAVSVFAFVRRDVRV